MSAERIPSTADSRDTLLLYCPYDRKVTRHARRGPDNAVVCVECGRRLEVSHAQRTAQIVPLPTTGGAYVGPRAARVRRSPVWRNHAQTPWIPFLLVGAVTIGTLFALLTALGITSNPFASNEAAVAAPPVVASESDVQVQTASEVAPVAAPEASAPAAATQLRIGNTGGTGAFIRRTPNMADRLRAWTDGTVLRVVGPDVTQNGVDWKHVQDPAGNDGWIPAQYVTAS